MEVAADDCTVFGSVEKVSGLQTVPDITQSKRSLLYLHRGTQLNEVLR